MYFFFEEIKRIHEQEAASLVGEYTQQQKRAGIQQLEKFKHFKTIDGLAGGDVLKYEDILQTEYRTIFMKLYYDKEKSDYEDRYNDVLRRDAKRKGGKK